MRDTSIVRHPLNRPKFCSVKGSFVISIIRARRSVGSQSLEDGYKELINQDGGRRGGYDATRASPGWACARDARKRNCDVGIIRHSNVVHLCFKVP